MGSTRTGNDSGGQGGDRDVARSAVHTTLLLSAVSLPATAAIGYAVGVLAHPGLLDPRAWPPAWWPFAGATCFGVIPMAVVLAGYGAVAAYRCGAAAIWSCPVVVVLQLGLLVLDLPRAQAKFASSSLFPLVVIYYIGATLGLALATGIGAALGLRHRPRRMRRRNVSAIAHGPESGGIA